MTHPLNEQRSNQWFAARRGRVTASRVSDLMAKTKSGYGAARANYMAQLVAERLTGNIAESFTNAAMQWGIDTEDHARAAYEFETDNEVELVGFIPYGEDAGASPDGLVGADGLVEIKCPNTATHINTLLTEKIDRKYILQMQFQMVCTDRKWCDFVSFDPRLPEEMQLWIQRVDRDEDLIAEISEAYETFIIDLKTTIDQLRGKYA